MTRRKIFKKIKYNREGRERAVFLHFTYYCGFAVSQNTQNVHQYYIIWFIRDQVELIIKGLN